MTNVIQVRWRKYRGVWWEIQGRKMNFHARDQKILYWESGCWAGPCSTERIWKQGCGGKIVQIIQWTNVLRREIVSSTQNTARRHFVGGEFGSSLCFSPNTSNVTSGHQVYFLEVFSLTPWSQLGHLLWPQIFEQKQDFLHFSYPTLAVAECGAGLLQIGSLPRMQS